MMNNSILITGCSTGLGKEMAILLAQRGFRVYATVRDMGQASSIEEAGRTRGVDLSVLPLDVTCNASIATTIEHITEESGGIYGVINNAGTGLRGYFEDLSEEEIRKVFEANVFGAMAVTKAALPQMRNNREGRVLFISSVGGRIGSLGVTAYCSTKFALEGFAESLYMELAPLNIQVVLIEPGIVKTERWTTNRGLAKEALNPASPYVDWFHQSEIESERLVQSSGTTPTDVAKIAYEALTTKQTKVALHGRT